MCFTVGKRRNWMPGREKVETRNLLKQNTMFFKSFIATGTPFHSSMTQGKKWIFVDINWGWQMHEFEDLPWACLSLGKPGQHNFWWKRCVHKWRTDLVKHGQIINCHLHWVAKLWKLVFTCVQIWAWSKWMQGIAKRSCTFSNYSNLVLCLARAWGTTHDGDVLFDEES